MYNNIGVCLYCLPNKLLSSSRVCLLDVYEYREMPVEIFLLAIGYGSSKEH